MKVNAYMKKEVTLLAVPETEVLVEKGLADAVHQLMDQGMQYDFEIISEILAVDTDIGGFRERLLAWAKKENKHPVYTQESDIYILALVGDKVVGIATLCTHADVAMQGGRIANVFVDEAYRRQGIAKQIIEYAIETCKCNNFAYMTLNVAANNEAAIALYRSLGFEPVRYNMMRTIPLEERNETGHTD